MSKEHKVASVFPTDKFPLKKRKYCMVPNSIGFSFFRFFPSETLFCRDSSNLYLLYSYIKPKTRNTSAMEKALGYWSRMDENSYLYKKGEEMSQTNFISSNGGDSLSFKGKKKHDISFFSKHGHF